MFSKNPITMDTAALVHLVRMMYVYTFADGHLEKYDDFPTEERVLDELLCFVDLPTFKDGKPDLYAVKKYTDVELWILLRDGIDTLYDTWVLRGEYK